MDNFKIIYKILNTLEKSMDLEEFDTDLLSSESLKVSQERLNKYLLMLYEAGYINGVSIKRVITGETKVNISNMAITLKGLEYLADNSIMQRIYNTAKGVRELL